MLLREGSYSTLRIGLYEPFKRILGEKNREESNIMIKLGGGLLSGLVGSLLCSPADLLKVRI